MPYLLTALTIVYITLLLEEMARRAHHAPVITGLAKTEGPSSPRRLVPSWLRGSPVLAGQQLENQALHHPHYTNHHNLRLMTCPTRRIFSTPHRAHRRRHPRAESAMPTPSRLAKIPLPSGSLPRRCLLLGPPNYPNLNPPAPWQFWEMLAATTAELAVTEQTTTPRSDYHLWWQFLRFSHQHHHPMHWRLFRPMQVPICLGSYPPQQIFC